MRRPLDERLFALLLLAYPREFCERYGDDLLVFFRMSVAIRDTAAGCCAPSASGAPRYATSGVSGVMPEGFTYPIGSTLGSRIDLWVPFVPNAQEAVRGGGTTPRW